MCEKQQAGNEWKTNFPPIAFTQATIIAQRENRYQIYCYFKLFGENRGLAAAAGKVPLIEIRCCCYDDAGSRRK